jgi:RimJ/RimL family protein N-acetyltransferase
VAGGASRRWWASWSPCGRFTRADEDERLDLAIVENATGEYAGEAVLNEYDAERNSAKFRIALRGPAWYGRGLGTEATRLIVDHGLRTIGLRAVTLSVLAVNPRAIRAYEKVRFRRTGETIEDGKAWVEMEITADQR